MEIIDKLYLELSTVSRATTAKELALYKRIKELEAEVARLKKCLENRN